MLVAQNTSIRVRTIFYLCSLTLLAARSVSEAVGAFWRDVAIDSGYAAAHPESGFAHRTETLIYLNLPRYPEAETRARAVATSKGIPKSWRC